jgi:hypothetical protein
MRKSLLVVLLAALAMLVLACGAKEKMDKAAIEADLENRGTTDLMKQTEDDQYTPPEDQRLTEAQIQMYLKVREHEKKIAQVAMQKVKENAANAEKKGEKSIGGMMDSFKALGSVADVLTADIRAAADLGYNTAEYQWVKEKVLEASGSAIGQQMADASTKMYDQSLEQMKKQQAEATDEASKKMIADMMASMEQTKKEMAASQQQVDPHVAYNRELLSKHEGALNAFAHELSKFEEKPGETQKAVQEFEKKLQEAGKETQQ